MLYPFLAVAFRIYSASRRAVSRRCTATRPRGGGGAWCGWVLGLGPVCRPWAAPVVRGEEARVGRGRHGERAPPRREEWSQTLTPGLRL